MPEIPENMQGSVALQFVQSQGWNWKVGTLPNIELEVCPKCKHSNFGHCYMEIHGPSDERKNRDGLFMCQRCGFGGNLYSLKQLLGLVDTNFSSQKEWASSEKKVDKLPNIEEAHQALMADADALDYLMNVRGWSREIIVRQKIGTVSEHYFKKAGKVKALVFPYLVNGNAVWVQYRTCPDINDLSKPPKDFTSPHGWEAVLYNGEVLKEGLKEISMVEGAGNCISAMDYGINDICGIPGANQKKAEWIDTLDKIGIEKTYICYDKDKAGQKAAQVIASRIGIERCWKVALPDFTVTTEAGLTRPGKDLNEWFRVGGGTKEKWEELKANAQLFDVDGVTNTQGAVDEFLEELEGSSGAGLKYKFPLFSHLVQFDDGDRIDVMAEGKVGKAQPLSSQVLRPLGWVSMGDLHVGDDVVSLDGNTSFITGIYPQGKKTVYTITFSDGRTVRCSEDHLWSVADADNFKRDGYRVLDTKTIQSRLERGTRLFVPLFNGSYGNPSTLPMSPWLLGSLLGDGGFTNGCPIFTKTDQLVVDAVRSEIAVLDCHLEYIDGVSWRIVGNGNVNNVTQILRRFDLMGKRSEEKHVPNAYLDSTPENRLALLHGLMDTDGSVEGAYAVPCFNTSSPYLVDAVKYLVRSLGGIAPDTSRIPKYKYKGEIKTGLLAFRVYPKISTSLFLHSTKATHEAIRTRDARLTIVSIEKTGKEEMQCVSVSHPSQLYITDGFTATHNTTVAMQMMEHFVREYHETGAIICLEMTRAKLARKWVSHKTGIADFLPETPEATLALTNQFRAAIPALKEEVANRDGDLLFCYPKYQSADDIYKLVIDCIRRYGAKWIMLDNLQRLCDTTIGNRNRTQYLSEISKTLSQICKDYNVQMILILQPHQIGAGRIIGARDNDGSSQVSKDCDCLITLHRNSVGEMTKDEVDKAGYIKTNETFRPEMLVSVVLSRYSAGGQDEFYFSGATSTLLPMSEGKILAMNAMRAAVGYTAQATARNMPEVAATAAAMSGEDGVRV